MTLDLELLKVDVYAVLTGIQIHPYTCDGRRVLVMKVNEAIRLLLAKLALEHHRGVTPTLKARVQTALNQGDAEHKMSLCT